MFSIKFRSWKARDSLVIYRVPFAPGWYSSYPDLNDKAYNNHGGAISRNDPCPRWVTVSEAGKVRDFWADEKQNELHLNEYFYSIQKKKQKYTIRATVSIWGKLHAICQRD